MKLVFFGDNKLGLIKDKTVVDLSGLVGEINAPTPQDLINTVISEFDSRYRARFLLEAESATGIPIRDANLHAPLQRPGQIVAMAANYLEDGALNTGAQYDGRDASKPVKKGDRLQLSILFTNPNPGTNPVDLRMNFQISSDVTGGGC